MPPPPLAGSLRRAAVRAPNAGLTRPQAPVTAARCQQNVLAQLTLFYMIMFVLANPQLAHGPSGNDAQADTAALQNQWKREEDRLEQTDRSYPKVEMFRETLLDEDDEIRGYRFVWIVLDDTFDIDRGIENLIRQNAEEAVKEAGRNKAKQGQGPEVKVDQQTAEKLARRIHSVGEYIDTVLRAVDTTLPYSGDVYTKSLSQAASLTVRLSLDRNLAATEALFPKEYQEFKDKDGTALPPLCEHVPLKPRHYEAEAYRRTVVQEVEGEDDDPVTFVKYSFPYGAACYRPEQQHHVVQSMMRLCDTHDMNDWRLELSDADAEALILENIHHARKVTSRVVVDGDRDLMDEMRDLNMRDMAGMTAEERYLFRRSATPMDRFMRVTRPEANVADAIKFTFAYGAHQMNMQRARGMRWTAMQEGVRIVDPSLDTCGNMLARQMLSFESTQDVSAVHLEILLCNVARMGASEHAYELKMHVLYLGPGASGKSYVQTVIKRFCIPGTCEELSHMTALAETAEMNLNGMVVFCDEMDDKTFDSKAESGKDKEALSAGKMTARSIKVVEGQRISTVTVARLQYMKICASNKGANEIPEALRTRYYVSTIPLWNAREGKDLVDHVARVSARRCRRR